ncbi:MAG: AAA domain-containing protein [Acidimicrobiales bacterium]
MTNGGGGEGVAMAGPPSGECPSESEGPLDDAISGRLSKAVADWTGQLVDLGGRNTLLYYRDLKQGTLDLSGETVEEAALGELLGGRTVRLSNLFPGTDLVQAARRARTLRAKAVENFEERGLQTLSLAWGMATWNNTRGTATPAAPVLLRQGHLASRGGAGEDFELSLPGEWEVNPTLLHLLANEFQVEIVAETLAGLLDDEVDPPDGGPVFARLVKEAAGVPGFEVSPRVVVGNFSYAKLPMVKDLDMDTAGDLLATSPLILAIAGDQGARQVLRDRHETISEAQPDLTPPADEFLVLDADSSQSYAINAAVSGADLVIEGPPGTGKSQTIANLIATLAARGKRVLFVAEKRAAIDAVLHRLQRVGLGGLVMDLHEGPGSRRHLAQQLSAALADASRVPLMDMAAQQERLARRRDDLRAAARAVYETNREPWGVTVYQMQAELLGLGPEVRSDQRLAGDVLMTLDEAACRTATEELESFIGLGGLTLASSTSPWVAALGAGTITSADQVAAALEAVERVATDTLAETAHWVRAAFAEVGLSEPDSLPGWREAVGLLDGVAETLEAFEPEVFDLDLAEVAAALGPASAGTAPRLWHRLSDASYQRARKALRRTSRGAAPHDRQLHRLVVAAGARSRAWRSMADDDRKPSLPSDLAGAKGSLDQLSREIEVVQCLVGQPRLDSLPHDELARRLKALLDDRNTLFRLPELHRLGRALDSRGLTPLVEEIRTRGLTLDQALACLRYVWLSSILQAVSITDVRIGAFDGPSLNRTAAEFRVADTEHIATTPARVRRAVAERITAARDAHPDESQVVANEAAKKQRHLPVRQLFQAAPHVLGALKPCWAMSPLVVAQLLPLERCFDVVIFDEASQVTPADAIGSLMRAERAVVAGDPHQLPPTSFFSTSGGGEDDEDVEAEAGGSLTRDLESVLDVMTALLPPPYGTRTLTWHYRSRDERLIAFSNAQPTLYDWSLTTFPGVSSGEVIRHYLVPFVSGRVGQEDSASDEVNRVVELVADHARLRPSESLGVIAMGIKHANRITEALRRARQDDRALDDFMSESAAEPFFVKNLERVQGDERDAIVLTIGYGKSVDGRMVYRFGPLNMAGGERRLNVAVTRARVRMAVVSSFSSSDMDPARLNAEGAKMLWRYLAYAESGGTDLGPQVKDRPELNPFERDVRDYLTAAGVPVVAQYGCSGYWIDFAAQHPTQPGHMVLAIEADGATYHASPTARERDRLRQEHLERLGWHFHRIWSTEWFRHREAEVARALASYREALDRVEHPSVPAHGPADGSGQTAVVDLSTLSTPASGAATHRVGPPPLQGGRGHITDYTMAELVSLIRWIESDTLLRTQDQLVDEAVTVLGFHRRGRNIVSAIEEAIALARRPQSPAVPLSDRPRPSPTTWARVPRQSMTRDELIRWLQR